MTKPAIVWSAAALLAGWAAAGCASLAPAGPAASQLAGQWQGRLVSRSTRDTAGRFEDFTLTILPGGRFATLGLVDASGLARAGQTAPAGQPGASVRALAAEYGVVDSRLAVEFVGLADEAGRAVTSGGTLSAHLRPDGSLEYHAFNFAMSAGDPQRCEALAQDGLLRRVPAATSGPAGSRD